VRSPSFPLTAAQQGIWLQEKLHPGTAFCNVGAYVEIDGLDLRKFEQALRHVVADTECLHVSFVEEDSEVRQRPVRRDASHLTFWYQRCRHLIVDGATMASITSRVASAYAAIDAGRPVPASHARGVADLVSSDRAYRMSADYLRDRSFWKGRWPLNANGKIDRKALPRPARSASAHRPFEAPHAGNEALLAEVWRELLGCERVSRHDDFFALGGYSLTAVKLTARVQARWSRSPTSSPRRSSRRWRRCSAVR
jgi:hypothetical protein